MIAMRRIAIITALVTVIVFNAVIWMGVMGLDGSTWFEAGVLVMNIAMPLSSALLGWSLLRMGRRVGAGFFAVNLVLLALLFVLQIGGVVASRGVLFALDLYVLNIYVILLARHGHELMDLEARTS